MSGGSATAQNSDSTIALLRQELDEARERLREANETLEAIRSGDVDAVVVGGASDSKVYTLENDDRPYRRLIEQIGEGALTLSVEGIILKMVELPQEQVIGGPIQRFVRPIEHRTLARLLADGEGRHEFLLQRVRTTLPVVISLGKLEEPGMLCGVITDLSEQKRAEAALRHANRQLLAETAERERTETMLRQAQKMEAVGQLTGGIAHDFNNLLQGILGSLEVLQRRIAVGRTDDLQKYTTAAITSAQRAGAMIQRLLAFARRQPLDPKPVEANRLLASMEDLLRRTLGPAIDLDLVLTTDPWRTLCDPNQLESAILNLAINSRDAMPEGGRLIVETANVYLDDAYARSDGGDDARPGQYVMVSVTDTGVGMSAEAIAKAFEPFFTTKPLGQGTGLGLSMLYGFVRQSDGHARIDSAQGRGTSVRLHLPRFQGEAEGAPIEKSPPGTAPPMTTGPTPATILVVDDEAIVRTLILGVLADLGYHAIEAVDGPSGLRILESDIRIDLLLTDVGLPGMTGRQLAEAARHLRPGLKVLFATGYAHNPALASGIALDAGMELISKPFPVDALSIKLREMIAGAA